MTNAMVCTGSHLMAYERKLARAKMQCTDSLMNNSAHRVLDPLQWDAGSGTAYSHLLNYRSASFLQAYLPFN